MHCGPSVNDVRLDRGPTAEEVAAKLAWLQNVVNTGPWPAAFLQPGIDQQQACSASIPLLYPRPAVYNPVLLIVITPPWLRHYSALLQPRQCHYGTLC